MILNRTTRTEYSCTTVRRSRAHPGPWWRQREQRRPGGGKEGGGGRAAFADEVEHERRLAQRRLFPLPPWSLYRILYFSTSSCWARCVSKLNDVIRTASSRTPRSRFRSNLWRSCMRNTENCLTSDHHITSGLIPEHTSSLPDDSRLSILLYAYTFAKQRCFPRNESEAPPRRFQPLGNT